MKVIEQYRLYENAITNIINKDYNDKLVLMEKQFFRILKEITIYIQTIDKYNHKNMPKIYIVVDSDFDGYSSAKVFYQFLSTIGVSREIINFVYLNCFHNLLDTIHLNKHDLLIILDTAYPNIKYEGEGFVWWIDHHEVGILDNMRANSEKNLIFINSQLNKNEIIKDLSCGLLSFYLLKIFIKKLKIKNVINEWESQTKLDALLSMISDMMPIHKYPAIIQGILESDKTNLYISGKTKWCFDNSKYFRKYTSRINNLIRMERYDLIEELIRGNGNEFILKDSERMNNDRNILLRTYFEPLNPKWEHLNRDFLVQIYGVPLEDNPVMRNHKGLLASMKTPTDRDLKYMILSRVSEKDKYNYSVRTNVDYDFKRYIRKHIDGIKIGGHEHAFGITLKKEYEDRLKEILSTIEVSKLKIEKRDIIKYSDIRNQGNTLDILWEIALENEFRIHPKGIEFSLNDFTNVEIFLKRTVYTLQLGDKEQEVVSFDLEKKDNIIAVPSCKEGIYEKYKIEMLEMGR